MILQALADWDNLRYWWSAENKEYRQAWERANSARNAAGGSVKNGSIATSAISALGANDESTRPEGLSESG